MEAFKNLIMSQQGKKKTKSLLDYQHNKNLKVFLRTSCAFSILCVVLQDSILQTGMCASRSSHTLSVLDCSYSARHQRSLILQL